MVFSGSIIAQEQYGNIRGVVIDEQGTPLPGVTVTLESELYSDRTMMTSEGGIFRFLNLSTGKCCIKCELLGFKTCVQENIYIQIGSNVDLKITLEPATLEEAVTVIAQSPVVDMKRTGAAVNITEEILQEVPSARDPWAILKQVPGILVSRENVGGSESGYQSTFMASGSWSDWNMYNMDGIPITDMVALGTSSRYYDFDSFEEMQIVTSGHEASMQSSGVSINFVTRRGGNKFQVVGRAFFTNDKLQGDNRTQELIDLDYVGNRIEQILDYGLQVGGPVVKNKLWFWAGYGVQDIDRLTIDGYPQNEKLEGVNVKLNFSFSPKNKAELAFILHEKSADGVGAGPFNPPETTSDQGGNGFPFLKLEDTHFFSENFLLTLKLASSWNKFWFKPKGGIDVQRGYDLVTGMYSGSAEYDDFNDRPSYNSMIDGNYFVEDILGGDHEIKFGIEYRNTPVRSKAIYSGDALKYYWNGQPFAGRVYRDVVWDYGLDRYSAYLNDIYTRGRFMLKLGFRIDREKSLINETSVRASRVAPEILPALTIPEIDPGLSTVNFSPRIGFSFDITGDGKTLIRGNAARYFPHISAWAADLVSLSTFSYATYYWNDLNGDDTITTNELVGYPLAGIFGFSGFDPWNPTKLESPNAIDPNIKSPIVDELILGIEREIFADFSLSLSFILRQNRRYEWYPFYDKETGAKETQADYIGPIQKSLTYDGKTYNYEYWTLNQYRYSGFYMENTPDAHNNYSGIEIVATKRLSHKWMMNASFNYQKFTWSFGEKGYLDPTNVDKWEGASETGLNASWFAKLSFLYKLPWGFNFSCFAHARQGYPRLQSIQVSTPERAAVGLGGSMSILLEKPGETRLENFYNVDISLVKDIQMGRYGQISLQVDAFNVFNFDHVLGRVSRVNSSSYNQITSILNPRVVRFGVRYRF
jgi:hypothetical protein